jgi:hypothetical protein
LPDESKGLEVFQVKRSLSLLFTLTVICSSAAVTHAHHSFAAQYDRAKPVTLNGTVTKVEWMNPHIYFYVDVKDDSGTVANWAVEGGNPSGLYRRGWKKDSLKVGDVVTVDGWLAKNGSKLANMRAVVLANGQQVFGGSSGGEER